MFGEMVMLPQDEYSKLLKNLHVCAAIPTPITTFVKLGMLCFGSKSSTPWVIDFGASNHMIDESNAFPSADSVNEFICHFD